MKKRFRLKLEVLEKKLTEFFTIPPDAPFPLDHWEINSIIIDEEEPFKMNFEENKIIRIIKDLLNKIYKNNYHMVFGPYIGDKRNIRDIIKSVQIIIIPYKGSISLAAYNVTMTQYFFIMRHYLDDIGAGGLCFILIVTSLDLFPDRRIFQSSLLIKRTTQGSRYILKDIVGNEFEFNLKEE